MTEEQQQKVSELLNEKSRLSSDLATLYNKEATFAVCFNYTSSFAYNIGFYSNRNKEINEKMKDLFTSLLQQELDKIEEELKQL